MEWTRAARYKRLSEVNPLTYEKLVEKVANSQYRQQFHIQPLTGLLNDPNGFSYFEGYYHLFYQWFPLGPVHGVKYWYHVKSKDLVDWVDEGIALAPDSKFDSHGVFSGTGLVIDEQLYLFYTGNTRTENWKRIPYQCIAMMDSKGAITKRATPFIVDSPEGYTDNFRDPKVFKQGNGYICLVGAERQGGKGAVVYYASKDLTTWELQGEIKVRFHENSGYMWECPDYFEINNQGILLLSPQGMDKKGDDYQNIFQSGYLIGEPINFANGEFEHQAFKELDRGFDFYAPQTMETPDGRRILIGWLGLPGVECVTDSDGWAHCLTLPRLLELKDNHLYQRPLPELSKLRKNKYEWSGKVTRSCQFYQKNRHREYELILQFKNIQGTRAGVKFRVGHNEETLFYYDVKEKKLIFDRSKSGLLAANEYGQVRKVDYDLMELKLQLFVDESSVEIFVNDGYYVFSSRIYNKLASNDIICFTDGLAEVEYTQWSFR